MAGARAPRAFRTARQPTSLGATTADPRAGGAGRTFRPFPVKQYNRWGIIPQLFIISERKKPCFIGCYLVCVNFCSRLPENTPCFSSRLITFKASAVTRPSPRVLTTLDRPETGTQQRRAADQNPAAPGGGTLFTE